MLDCLRAQTFKDYELILVDNGSTDGTAGLCAAYAASDGRVKPLSIRENAGASFGRNAGLAAASGEYIAFVDDDDRCEPELLRFLTELAREEGADISVAGSMFDFGGRTEPKYAGGERSVFGRADALRELLKRRLYNVAPPGKLFRRVLWDGLTFPGNVLVDDIHVVYKAFERARRVAVWNRPLYYFRRHESNMTAFTQTKKLTPELLDEYIAMYLSRAEYLRDRIPEISKDIDEATLAFMKNMCQNIIENSLEGCERQLEYMKEYLKSKGS
jgi:glycosyltransferase involved in cell wall biosynthesis